MRNNHKCVFQGLLCRITTCLFLAFAGMLGASGQTIDNPVELWVGEPWQYEVTMNLSDLSSYSWSSSSSSLNCVGNGLQFTAQPTKYFSGAEYVKFSFVLDFGLMGSRQFYVTCKENPVHISPSTLDLPIGGSDWVSFSHEYNNQYSTSANAGITYSSSNTSVATVTNDGRVVAKGVGSAKIYVHSNLSNDDNTPYCTVTVTSSSPTLVLPKTMTLNIGHSETIVPAQSPGASYSLTWSSGNTSVATVNSTSGKVTAKKKGTARITARINGYDVSDYCDVTVTAIPESITLPNEFSLYVGETKALTPTVTPVGAEYSLSWTSSNTSVATVSSMGYVTAKKKGTARITARINGYNLSDYCTVTVSDFLRGDVDGDGSVSISDVSALAGILLGFVSTTPAADVNGDGTVDVGDLTYLLNMLLTGEGLVIKGDVNGDGSVNIEDVTSLMNYILKGGTINQANADMNGDGSISIEDVTALISLLLTGNS